MPKLLLVRTSSADRSTPPRPPRPWRRGLRTAGFDDVVEVPLADGGEGTLDALLAARGGSRRTASVTGPLGGTGRRGVGPALRRHRGHRDGARERARARRGTTRSAAREHARHRRADRRRGARAGATRIIVVRRRQRDDRRWARRGRGARLVARRARRRRRVRRRARRFTDAAEVYGPQKGASAAQVALLTRRLEQLVGVYRQRTGVDVTELEGGGAAGGLAGGLAALGARLEPGLRGRRAGRGARRRARRRGARRDRRGQARRHELRGQGRRRRARVGRRRRASRTARVIVGQATDAAREEASVLGDVQVLALTDRVLAGRRGVRARRRRSSRRPRSRPAAAPSAGSHVTLGATESGGELAAVLAAVGGDRCRSAGARAPRPRPPRARSRRCSGRARPTPARSETSPARRSAVTRIAVACGPSSASERLRCSRTPRSTCAVGASPKRSTTSTSSASSTPQPSTNGSVSSTSRRPAYSPESGCTKRASCGNSVEISGRAISSVTRPPPSGWSCSGRR